MTNFNLIYTISLVLLSCSSTKNIDEINKDFTVISAQKSTWFGGRDGVKGTNYYFILKNNQKQTFKFTDMKIGKINYPIRTEIRSGKILISASVSDDFQQSQVDLETGQEIKNKMPKIKNDLVSLDYYLGNSKIIHILTVNYIKVIESKVSGEALPN